MPEKSLEELTEDDIAAMQVNLRNPEKIQRHLSMVTIDNLPILAELLSLAAAKNPYALMNRFFNAVMEKYQQEGGCIRRPSFYGLIEDMPRLAMLLQPGEFAKEIGDWHTVRARDIFERYEHWYVGVSLDRVCGLTEKYYPQHRAPDEMSTGNGSIVREEAQTGKD
ncbi:MAG: hypothetical protein V1743_03070 [Nanoarchaeota archaeon]